MKIDLETLNIFEKIELLEESSEREDHLIDLANDGLLDEEVLDEWIKYHEMDEEVDSEALSLEERNQD